MLTSRLALLAGLLLVAGPVFAADDEVDFSDVREVVPGNLEARWYGRADIGYSFSNGLDNGGGEAGGVSLGEDTSDIFGGVGIGYRFNDTFRADITGGYLATEEVTAEAGGLQGTAKSRMAYGFATAYADLVTVMHVTPYLGAGAGFVHANNSTSGNLAFPDAFSADDTAFAFTLNAGLSYRVAERMSVDLGYQYMNAPDLKHFSPSATDFRDEGFDMHQVKLGLRFDLW